MFRLLSVFYCNRRHIGITIKDNESMRYKYTNKCPGFYLLSLQSYRHVALKDKDRIHLLRIPHQESRETSQFLLDTWTTPLITN